MNRAIYTYTELERLGTASFWNEIKNYPQITVTADLRKSLKGTQEFDKVEGILKDDEAVTVCEFRKLSELLLPKWVDDETKFHEMVILSQFLREKIEKSEYDLSKKRWLVGCRRNLGMILSSIIMLEEANIAPEDMDAKGDRNVTLLLEAWRYLKAYDPAIGLFHKRLNELKRQEAWEPIMLDLFGKLHVDVLVFHGFYYFTPLQERIMRLMEMAGIRLVFLFPYNKNYPYAYEIWRRTYSVEKGYPPVEDWHCESSTAKDCYGEIFEGRKCKVSNKLKIQEYASVMEFVHGIKHVKEQGYFVYASNNHAVNEILRDFYPDEYGERKLLSYPIGQFVSILNRMWDDDAQDIVLDEEKLIDCFASGWLSYEGNSGKQYLQDLAHILPFFANCHRIREWEARIELLLQIEDEVIAPFKKTLSMDDHIARWQEIMENPFLNFSVFAVPEEKLNVILNLIKQLLSMARELFGTNQMIRIQDHIDKLDQILKKHELSNELYDEERELIKDLFAKLADSSGFTASCFPGDISGALNLYMSGHFNDGEIQTNKIGMVSPIYQIDAASVKHDGKVHICFCDVNQMPGGRKEYVWPLTSRHIKDCYQRSKNPLIVNMMHIMDCAYICNRYFLYSGLRNKDVQLSWISDMGDKLQAPSAYVKLLCEAADVHVTPARRDSITYKRVEESMTAQSKIAAYDVKRMPAYTAKEARMDYAICPIKYTLGYVVDKFPTFQGTFHLNYAMNGLIAAITDLMKGNGISSDEVYENVAALFPAMRRVEKRQVKDYLEYNSGFTDSDAVGMSELEKKQYTEERLKIQFPNKDVREQAHTLYGKLLTPDGRTGMNLFQTAADTITSPYKKVHKDVCLFCQHQNYCKYAVFAVDQEVLYD